MAISYFGVDDKTGYVLNNIREENISKDLVLLVNDYGAWVVLNKDEYRLLKSKKDLPASVFHLLKENGIILTKDNISNIIKDYRKKLSFLFNGPSLHIIVPTSRCNQDCIYCHAKSSDTNKTNPDMDEETAKKVVEFIFQTSSPAIKIEFQGGEPLLNFDIVKFIIEYTKKINKNHKKKVDFAISTNLTLMNEDILKYLVQNRISITTSFDGPKYVHDKNRIYCSGNGTYKDMVKWINIIAKKYSIESLLVITKHSLPYHKEIIDEYLKVGMNLIWVQPIRKMGNALKNWNDVGYTSQEFFDFWKNSLEYILNLNKKGKQIKEISTTIILKNILKKSCLNFCGMQSPCGAIVSQLAYDEKGDIYVCDNGRQDPIFRLGNVKESGYEDIMLSEKAQDFIKMSINDNLLCDDCTWKPFCGICPAANYFEHGNIIPKLPLSERCRINKNMIKYVFEKFLLDEQAKTIFLEWIKTPGIV